MKSQIIFAAILGATIVSAAKLDGYNQNGGKQLGGGDQAPMNVSTFFRNTICILGVDLIKAILPVICNPILFCRCKTMLRLIFKFKLGVWMYIRDQK